jgi:membrane protein
MFLKKIRTTIQSVYQRVNHRSGGVVDIILTAGKSFDEQHGAEAAASISYYSLFSMFPLLLFLVSILGFFIEKLGAPIEIAELITQAIPISSDLVYSNLVQILNARSLGGIIGLIGLMWAASSVFITVSRNINRAWSDASVRNLIQNRLVAFTMIVILLVLTGGWIASTILFGLVPKIVIPFFGEIDIFKTQTWYYLSNLLPWSLAFLILLGLYFWIPNTPVKLKEAFWGALIASIALNLATRVFTWLLSSGLATFDILYGSLGTALALLTWVYISALIVLIGAHLSSAIAQVKRKGNRPTGGST